MDDTMPGGDPDDTSGLRSVVADALERAWVDVGYTAPNLDVYPWLWLWDSCFHALVWSVLDRPERALRELDTALSTIDGSGFVPHMGYQLDPQRPLELWGRRGSSSITQPPMYGHAVAELTRAGVDVPAELVDRAKRGLWFLLARRARDPQSGLVTVVHPWETGCDDSPRWDGLLADGFELTTWREEKMALLGSIVRGPAGEPLANPALGVAPAGFNALVAFNAAELAAITGERDLADAASELSGALDARFDDDLRTWPDAGPTGSPSARARTADGLLPLLVTRDARIRHLVVEELLDDDAHASPHGPRGVHVREPSYDPSAYWRGPVWPQLAYLLWLATHRGRGPDEADAAEVIRTTTVAGARRSGLAEYWNGETGEGLGAIPQSWTGLALVLASTG